MGIIKITKITNIMAAIKRINKEIIDLSKEDKEGIEAGPLEEKNIFKWQATIMGPEETPYEGGVFFLNIDLPEDYPNKPPTISFTSRIYHPNIDSNGKTCLNILKDEWSMAITISKVLDVLVQLLREPNPDDALDGKIAGEYKDNKE